MKNSITAFIIITIFLFGNTATAQLFKDIQKTVEKSIGGSSGTGLSINEISDGLKQALEQGTVKGVNQVSQVDGYFKDPKIKIPMPAEAQAVESKLRQLGQSKIVDDAILSINRAAEDAASEAKDIFVASIKQMTIQDAQSILKGSDDAATNYLDKTTRGELTQRFTPAIDRSLSKVGATKHWEDVFNNYNRIPFVKKINPDLSEYVTQKAIDGLFVQIAEEELKIRQDPAARATDLLKKVFGQ